MSRIQKHKKTFWIVVKALLLCIFCGGYMALMRFSLESEIYKINENQVEEWLTKRQNCTLKSSVEISGKIISKTYDCNYDFNYRIIIE